MSDSPLKRYKRQPKLSIDLPSKGKWWPQGSCSQFTDLEVYSMTVSDEIATKTPDILFSGQTTANIIKNCIPSIKDPWKMPVIDLYTVLSAIRLASYGEEYSLGSKCNKCGEEGEYSVHLNKVIDQFHHKEWQEVVYVEDFTFYLQPMNYKEITEVQKQNYSIQRQLVQQILKMEESQEKSEKLREAYTSLAGVRAKIVLGHVVGIEVDGETETNRNEIESFLINEEKKYYREVEKVVLANTQAWSIPPVNVDCSNEECDNNWEMSIDLDYSNFFVTS